MSVVKLWALVEILPDGTLCGELLANSSTHRAKCEETPR